MGWIEKKAGPRGTTYKATVRTATHDKRSRTFKRKADADRWITVSEAAVVEGRYVDPRSGRITVAEAFESWMAGAVHLADSTREKYRSGGRNHVVPGLGHVRLSDLQQPAVRDWIAGMHRSGVGRPTIENARAVLSLVCAQAVADKKIPGNPISGTKLPREGGGDDHDDRLKPNERRLTTDEVWAIADAIEPRYRAMVLVAGFCGLRIGEVAGLRWGRVDLVRRKITIREQTKEVAGKVRERQRLKTTSSYGTVPMPRFVSEALASHGERFGPTGDDDLIFTSPNGGPLSRSNFRARSWIPTLRQLGIPPARFHLLRHHTGVAAAETGVHPAAIRDLMRHGSIRVTFDVYVDDLPSLADDVGDRMERFARDADVIPIAAGGS